MLEFSGRTLKAVCDGCKRQLVIAHGCVAIGIHERRDLAYIDSIVSRSGWRVEFDESCVCDLCTAEGTKNESSAI